MLSASLSRILGLVKDFDDLVLGLVNFFDDPAVDVSLVKNFDDPAFGGSENLTRLLGGGSGGFFGCRTLLNPDPRSQFVLGCLLSLIFLR